MRYLPSIIISIIVTILGIAVYERLAGTGAKGDHPEWQRLTQRIR